MRSRLLHVPRLESHARGDVHVLDDAHGDLDSAERIL